MSQSDYAGMLPELPDERELGLYVQDRFDYYQLRWRRAAQQGTRVSWNWAACFLTSYWLLYRKMYAYFFIYYLGTLALGSLLGMTVVLLIPFWIALFVLPGMFGNWIYYDFISKKIRRLKLQGLDEGLLDAQLTGEGGVSMAGPLILIGVQVVMLLLMLLLFALAFSGGYAELFTPAPDAPSKQ